MNPFPSVDLAGIDKHPREMQDKFTDVKDEIKGIQQNKAIEAMNATSANPFDDPKYANVNVPDIPMQQQPGMVETLINDKEVPEKIREKYWWIFHKDNVLGFMDEKRKEDRMLAFDIAKIDALACMPYYDYDFETEQEIGILRNTFETKLDRSLGVKTDVKNERVMLQSQFTEQKQIQENASNNIQSGFFKRMLGR